MTDQATGVCQELSVNARVEAVRKFLMPMIVNVNSLDPCHRIRQSNMVKDQTMCPFGGGQLFRTCVIGGASRCGRGH